MKDCLPSHFPEDCIMLSFFIVGVDISSHVPRRYPSLNACTWGFPQELALISINQSQCSEKCKYSYMKKKKFNSKKLIWQHIHLNTECGLLFV